MRTNRLSFIVALLLLVVVFVGCAAPTYVIVDQQRKDAIYGPFGPIASHVEKYPEQAQTWNNFGEAWQRDIDANMKSARPWWLGGGKAETPPATPSSPSNATPSVSGARTSSVR